MAIRFSTLEAKSVSLHGQSTDEVLKVNRAILRVDPANVAATNRLGIAHMDRGEAEEALAVFEAGLAANPGNHIAAHRIEYLLKRAVHVD